MDDYLIDAGLAKASSETTDFLARIQKGFEFVHAPYGEYLEEIWSFGRYIGIASGPHSGPLFEMLIASIFIGAGRVPFYRKAELEAARKVESDFLFWDRTNQSPICVEVTSTLRERYKLADLQAFKVKASFPKAKFFQLTMDFKDAARRSSNDFESLDGLIYAGSSEIEQVLTLIESLDLGSEAPLQNNKNTSLHFFAPDGSITSETVF